MALQGGNVISLFPHLPGEAAGAEQRRSRFEQDRRSLAVLSHALQIQRRELAEATRLFEAAATASAETPNSHPRDLLHLVEALETSMNRLVGAMSTHQPR